MEITQSEVARYFLDEWPGELEESRDSEFARRTYDRLESEYSFLDQVLGNSYHKKAAEELASNPEDPETERAQELKKEMGTIRHPSEPGFDDEEFAEWEMEWMAEMLPLEKIRRSNSNFGSRVLGSDKVYQWENLEIGHEHDGKYAAFSFNPLEDPHDLTDLAAELDTEINYDSMVKLPYTATSEGTQTEGRQQWYDVDHTEEGLEVQSDAESLDVKLQAEYADHVDEVLEILGWKDQEAEADI